MDRFRRLYESSDLIKRGYHSLPDSLRRQIKSMYDIVTRAQMRIEYTRRIGALDVDVHEPKNVLIIVADSLRADHTSQAGYERDTTPGLSEWDVVSTETVSAAPWTFPSVPTILTGKYPHNHGAIVTDDYRNIDVDVPLTQVTDDTYTLAELLGAAGYATWFQAAIETARLGLDGRFGSLVVEDHLPAAGMRERFFEWWDANESTPKCAYVHLGDLHQPLAIPDEQPFGRVDADIDGITDWRFQSSREPEAEWRTYRDERGRLYDSLIHYTDRQLQQWLQGLEDRGDREDTLTVFVGDHGEEFWDHVEVEQSMFDDPRGVYGIGHGHAVWQEVIQVPLALDGIEVDDRGGWWSTADIVPTLVQELGLQTTCSFDGCSLQRGVPDNRTVLSQEIAYGYEQTAVLQGSQKYITSTGNGLEFAFDLAADPGETDNLIGTNVGREIRQSAIDSVPVEKQHGTDVSLSGQTRNQLEELGYL